MWAAARRARSHGRVGERHPRRGVSSDGTQPQARYPVRADYLRPQDNAEQVLAVGALQRVRLRTARHAGPFSRDEGRRRLGRRLHRSLLRSSRIGRLSLRSRAPLGRWRHHQPRQDDRGRTRPRRARRRAALVQRPALTVAGNARGPAQPVRLRIQRLSRALHLRGRRRRRRHKAIPRHVHARREARRRCRFRLRGGLRRRQQPAHAIPGKALQPAQRQVRRLARKQSALLCRADERPEA